jgi:DNA repair exonuclease SbcCD nuclease subunit
MGRIAFCADVHLANHRAFGGAVKSGLNDRARAGLRSLAAAIRVAEAAGCDSFTIVGDVFDGVNPSPQLERAARDALACAARVDLLVGNHDRNSTASGDHALGPLEVPGIFAWEAPGLRCNRNADGTVDEVWLVPHEPGTGAENLRRALSDLGARSAAASDGLLRRRVLALHYGVSDEGTASYLARADDAVSVNLLFGLMREWRISAAFAGNWHRAQTWSLDGMVIVQLGALAPRDFRDEGVEGYGGLAIYDGDSDEVRLEEIPGDRFVIVRDQDAQEEAWKTVQPPSRLFLRRVGMDGSAKPAVDDVAGVEDVADLHEAEVATRAAAGAARGKDTLDEALAAFVAEMPLAEEVDRDAVLKRCRAFLKDAEG